MASKTASNGRAGEKTTANMWVIHGEAYDCSAFVKNHPGGSLAISLGQNRDCTALFESYHALSGDKACQILQKYKIKNADAAAVQALTQYKWSVRCCLLLCAFQSEFAVFAVCCCFVVLCFCLMLFVVSLHECCV